MEKFNSFEKLISVLAKKTGIIFLLGHTDTGKTTFSKKILKAYLKEGKTAGFIDSDVGQSTIGPPATIGAANINSEGDLANLGARSQYLYFVGSTSPRGNFLPMVLGTYNLTNELSKNDCLVIDTTGLVLGSYGQVLKYNKITFIKPNYLILFEREDELGYYKEIFQNNSYVTVCTLKVGKIVKKKSPKYREEKREESFQNYFNMASEITVDLKNTSTFPPKEFFIEKVKKFNIIGLEDSWNRCLGLGIFLNLKGNKLKIYTPVESSKIKFLKLGSIQINKDGEQI